MAYTGSKAGERSASGHNHDTGQQEEAHYFDTQVAIKDDIDHGYPPKSHDSPNDIHSRHTHK
jgi:hypothetical protein